MSDMKEEIGIAKIFIKPEEIYSVYVQSQNESRYFRESVIILLRNIFQETNNNYLRNLIVQFMSLEHFEIEEYLSVIHSKKGKSDTQLHTELESRMKSCMHRHEHKSKTPLDACDDNSRPYICSDCCENTVPYSNLTCFGVLNLENKFMSE